MKERAEASQREDDGQSGFCTLFTKSVPHILEKIFFSLDYGSYKQCLNVSHAWKELLISDNFVIRGKVVFKEEISKDEKSLLEASVSGKLIEVRRLLSTRMVNVNCVDDWQGFTPLYKAAYCGHREVAGVLLEAGAEIDKADRNGRTPLNVAALKGHRDTVEMLLDRGANCDKVSSIYDVHY